MVPDTAAAAFNLGARATCGRDCPGNAVYALAAATCRNCRLRMPPGQRRAIMPVINQSTPVPSRLSWSWPPVTIVAVNSADDTRRRRFVERQDGGSGAERRGAQVSRDACPNAQGAEVAVRPLHVLHRRAQREAEALRSGSSPSTKSLRPSGGSVSRRTTSAKSKTFDTNLRFRRLARDGRPRRAARRFLKSFPA